MDTQGKYTALHYAVKHDKLHCVKLLTQLGADVTITDDDHNDNTSRYNSKIPLQRAMDKKHSSIVYYFVKEYNQDISMLDQNYQQRIEAIIQQYEKEVEKIALALALRDGTAKALGIKLLLFGAENVGKTCVAATLVGDPFQENSATKGADISICNASNWKKITKEEVHHRLQIEYLDNLAISTDNNTASAKTSISEKEAESISTTPVAPPRLAEKEQQGTNSIAKNLPLPKVAAEEMAAVKAAKEKGVTKVFKMRNGINVTILDFAGQVQYHNTHSIFVRKDNVIMIVFNASQPLSTNVKVRSSTLQKDPMTYSQNIHFWMKTVHSICHEPGDATDKASLLPVIILVATHLDILGASAEETKEQIIKTLAEELTGKPYARHLAGHGEGLLNALRKYCIFLSNKIRDPKNIKQLQDAIIEVSFPILSREHPLVYLKIERELLSIQKGVITIEEFHTVVQGCGFLAAIDSKEFVYAVEYFHHNGTVLNFASIESLKKLVILSPHWVTKLLSYLLIAHPYKNTGNGRDISFNNLKRRGILLESFLSYMLDCFNNSGVAGYQIQQNEAVDLMKWFGFIAQISPKTKILDKEVKIVTREKGLYIVPSLLPGDDKDQKVLPEKDEKNVRIVYYHFPDEFLPIMLFNQLVAMCINRNEEKREDLIWLRKGKVKIVLDRNQQYCVSLHEDTSSIQLSFLLHGKDSSAEQRYQLFQFIQSKLEQLMNDFMQASTKPKAYVPCCYDDCHEFHVELQLLFSKEYQYCATQDKPIPDDYYSDLFPDQVTSAPDQSANSQVTSAEVDSPATDLEILSKDIYDKFYPQLVALLPMKDAIFVSHLVQLLPGDLKEKVQSKQTQAEAATYFLDNTIKPAIDCGDNKSLDILLSAMQSFGSNPLRELAQKIKEEFKKAVGSSFIGDQNTTTPQNTVRARRKCLLL